MPSALRSAPGPMPAPSSMAGEGRAPGGGGESAGGENDLAGAELGRLAVDDRGDAGDAPALEDKSPDRRGTCEGQVLPRAHGAVEIAHRRRGAPLDRAAHRQRAIAVAE